MNRPGRIVICGGGVIGAAIAYFLSKRGARAIVIERHEVAGAASGKSGGFLALDWCRGTPLDRLARRSFALHAELADTLGNPWGFRRLDTYGGHAALNNIKGRTARSAKRLPWLSDSVTITGQIGGPETTARTRGWRRSAAPSRRRSRRRRSWRGRPASGRSPGTGCR